MRFLAMEDEEDSDFDDLSLQQWRRKKMCLEKVYGIAPVSRSKVRRGSRGRETRTEAELEDRDVHDIECKETGSPVVESDSPSVVCTPSTPDNSAKCDSHSVCMLDEDQCTIPSPPPLTLCPSQPSPRKTRDHHDQRLSRGSPRKRCREKGQTLLYQFATTTHRSMSDSLKAQELKTSQTGHKSSKGSKDTAHRLGLHKPSEPRQTSGRDSRGSQSTGTSAVIVAQGVKQTRRRQCPFYKRVPETGMVVDAFSYGSIPNCPAYFLSHFHSDHYMGLNRRFTHPIYCTQVTANLVQKVLKVSPSLLHPLPLDEPCTVEGTEVTLIDANHCPGSVMLLFKTTSGRSYLHTGDFRYCAGIARHPSLKLLTIHQVFMDTTYCRPRYSFPTQEEVIEFAVVKSQEALHRCPHTVVVSGTYTVGKERVFLALAEALESRVCVTREKEGILRCLQWPALEGLLTTSPLAAKVHVLPMKKLNIKDLSVYLESLRPSFSRLLAFIPTGWSHSNSRASLSALRPKTAGSVSVYSVPYSEHSSFTELQQFVEFLQPRRVVPTVGNQSAQVRREMLQYIQQWMKRSTV